MRNEALPKHLSNVKTIKRVVEALDMDPIIHELKRFAQLSAKDRSRLRCVDIVLGGFFWTREGFTQVGKPAIVKAMKTVVAAIKASGIRCSICHVRLPVGTKFKPLSECGDQRKRRENQG